MSLFLNKNSRGGRNISIYRVLHRIFALAPPRDKVLSGNQPIQETRIVCNIVAGVVTLVMACIILGRWLRPDIDEVVVAFPLLDLRMHYFALKRDRVVWVAIRQNGRPLLPTTLINWATQDFGSDRSVCQPFLFFDRRRFDWQGLNGGEKVGGPMIISITTMPYWSVLLPLTLLSAFLLLSKPRKSEETH